jgi:hypothetical protein
MDYYNDINLQNYDRFKLDFRLKYITRISSLNIQLALRVVAIGIVHYQVYIYLGHQVSNATMHYRFCQVGMD